MGELASFILLLYVFLAGLMTAVIWFPYYHLHILRINPQAIRELFGSDLIYRASMERCKERAVTNSLLLPIWPIILIKKGIDILKRKPC